MRFSSSFVVPTLVLVPCAAFALAPATPVPDDLEELIEGVVVEAMREFDLPGVSLYMDLGGDAFYSGGWGHVDVARGDTAGPDSSYRVGTLIEQLIAFSLLREIESGELEREASVGAILGVEFEEELTVWQLLNHTSGLPLLDDVPGAITGDRIDPAATLAALTRAGRDSAPGSCFSYSRANTLLAGMVLEKHTEQPVAEHLRSTFFEPLGMSETLFCETGPRFRELADVSQEVSGGFESMGPVPYPFEARDLCSSARDLARLLRALVDRRAVGDQGFEWLSTPVKLGRSYVSTYACGVNLASLGDEACMSFGGGMGGSRFHVAYYPDADLTVVLASSAEDAPVDRLERRIARLFFGQLEPTLQDRAVPVELGAAYAGEYYIACNAWTVLYEGERLRVRTPDGEVWSLLFQGQHEFVRADDPGVRLVFQMGAVRAHEFLLDDHGSVSTGRRL